MVKRRKHKIMKKKNGKSEGNKRSDKTVLVGGIYRLSGNFCSLRVSVQVVGYP
jgi:hypothetical protein